MDYEEMERIPVDPRVVERIQRSPAMRSEQGGTFLEGWGGPSQYQVLAELPMEQRLTYAAVLDGHTTEDQIEIATGLTSEQVSRGLAGLQARRLVQVEKETL